MAGKSRQGADACAERDPRSAGSRYHYSAYQAASAILQHLGQHSRKLNGQIVDAWSHSQTPDLLNVQLKRVMPAPAERLRMVSRLRSLYKVRLYSDYVSGAEPQLDDLKWCRRNTGQVIKLAEQVTGFKTDRGGN